MGGTSILDKDSISHILDQPIKIEGVGDLHSIKLKHYDEFMRSASLLTYGYQMFDMEKLKEDFPEYEFKLLDLIYGALKEDVSGQGLFESLARTFSYAFREDSCEFEMSESGVVFYLRRGIINSENYDEIREVIMWQNVIHEQKVYKNKRVQEWAEKTLKARASSGIDLGLQEYITSLAIAMGKTPSDFAEMTIYQLKTLFARLGAFKTHETNLALIGHSTEIGKEHYAEKVDIHKNPYDDVFVKDSKLNKLKDSLK